jgi:hypothetical protein
MDIANGESITSEGVRFRVKAFSSGPVQTCALYKKDFKDLVCVSQTFWGQFNIGPLVLNQEDLNVQMSSFDYSRITYVYGVKRVGTRIARDVVGGIIAQKRQSGNSIGLEKKEICTHAPMTTTSSRGFYT